MKDSIFGKCDEVAGVQYSRNLYSFSEGIQAKRILEIGAGWGCSGRAFAASLKGRFNTLLVSVDKEPKRMKSVNSKFIAGAVSEWKFLTDRSQVEDSGFDLAYVDADPNLAMDDASFCLDRLRPGGLLVLDGYGGQYGPTQAAEELGGFIVMNYCPAYAHALYRKPASRLSDGLWNRSCQVCSSRSVEPESWGIANESAYAHTRESGHGSTIRCVERPLVYQIWGAA